MPRNLTREPDDKARKVPKITVNYRRGSKAEHCGNCSMYRQAEPQRQAGTCTHVAGLIYAEDTCDDWEAKK